MKNDRKQRFARRRLVALVAVALSGSPYAAHDASGVSAQLLRLPITFERNDGQLAADVLFASQGRHGSLVVRGGEIAIAPRLELGERRDPVRLRMLGANLAPEVHPERALVTRSHYYTGAEPILDVPHFAELHMKDVYPGIDIALHGRDGELEYDFVVAPGADPRDIRIDLREVDSAFIDGQGNLRFEHQGQLLAQRAPVAYQGDGEERRPVDAHFEILEGPEGPEARIALGAYDAQAPLTVDPVIAYSTYVGSSGGEGMKIRVNPAGHVFYATTNPGTGMKVLNRLNPATNTIIYQTTFGGGPGVTTVSDIGIGTVGGSADGAYVAGHTTLANFPIAGLPIGQDGFVASFRPDGTLHSGTRIGGVGGSGDETARALCIDTAGNLYVGGRTNSPGFPVTSGQTRTGTGSPTATTDAYIAKFTAGFSQVYRRLHGGSGNDEVLGCAVNAAGELVVVGSTTSPDFPIANATAPLSPAPSGGLSRAFAAKLDAAGTTHLYSQYLGGSASAASAVAVDPTTGDAVVAGSINGPLLIPSSTRPYGGGATDGYLVRLSPSGAPLSSTYLGGGGVDTIAAVAVSPQADIYLVGNTGSIDFPVVNPIPGGGSRHGTSDDAFVTRLRAGAIDFSTYLGGSGTEFGVGVATDMIGSVYVGGITSSLDFPLVTPLYATPQFSTEAFVTKITGLGLPAPTVANISTRMQVLTGNDVLIGGFVIGGSATKRVAIVATGPSLTAFGITDPLANPRITLVRSSDQAVIATNDDWQSAANAAQLTASGFAPSNALEAAILADLAPGAYTAIVEGVGGTGVAVVGIYEVNNPQTPLINISTRGRVLTGNDVMIGGFVIGGSNPQTVAIVATGPSLAAFGIASPLANPKVTVVRSSDQSVVATNDDWQAGTDAAQLQAAGFAPSNPLEAGLLLTLPPGAYTAIVEGVGGTTGVAVVGVYAVN